MNRKKKVILILVLAMVVLVVIATCFGFVDNYRLHRFEKPVFCINMGENKQGIEHLQGLGYSFDIDYSENPEFPGIARYRFHILGIKVGEGVRE